MTDRERKAARARRLRDKGLLGREIAAELECALSTAYALLDDPDGSKLKARKDSYRGRCKRCGNETTGCNGPSKAPKRCIDCYLEDRESAMRREVIAAWNAGESSEGIGKRFGISAVQVSEIANDGRRHGKVVARRHLPHKGTTDRFEKLGSLVRAGLSDSEIADRIGAASPQSVTNMIWRARKRSFDIPYRADL